MADPSSTGKTDDRSQAAARSCAFCGHAILEANGAPERFGEAFCSNAHADGFATGVRAVRVQLAAAAEAVPAGRTEVASPAAAPAKPARWKMALKMAACCAAPLLVAIVLAGGAGAMFGAAASVLPLLAGLACPIGMFFIMRAMMKHGQGNSGQGQDKSQDMR